MYSQTKRICTKNTVKTKVHKMALSLENASSASQLRHRNHSNSSSNVFLSMKSSNLAFITSSFYLSTSTVAAIYKPPSSRQHQRLPLHHLARGVGPRLVALRCRGHRRSVRFSSRESTTLLVSLTTATIANGGSSRFPVTVRAESNKTKNQPKSKAERRTCAIEQATYPRKGSIPNSGSGRARARAVCCVIGLTSGTRNRHRLVWSALA